jgi:DNA-binding NarL/FixJ family response regulator
MTESTTNKRKVFLVDDHPLVREWLTSLINQQTDLAVCGEAASVLEAMEAIATAKPDVAVVDLSLKDSSGIELIKNLKQSHPKVVVLVLSMHDESLYAERALRAGARGYIMKCETTKKVVTAIHQILEGKLYVSDQIAAAMVEKFVAGQPGADELSVSLLSDRELEVFQFLGQGRETKQIADDLHISLKTVQAYCDHIKTKLKLANATELRREAVRWEGQHNRV